MIEHPIVQVSTNKNTETGEIYIYIRDYTPGASPNVLKAYAIEQPDGSYIFRIGGDYARPSVNNMNVEDGVSVAG